MWSPQEGIIQIVLYNKHFIGSEYGFTKRRKKFDPVWSVEEKLFFYAGQIGLKSKLKTQN